ncbi:MAG: molybdopterin molybdenumtransferase MoeA, partial [Oceanibaculum sp.]
LGPAISRLLGQAAKGPEMQPARLAAELKPNDRRQDYLRATLTIDADGTMLATPFAKQDSSQFSLLTRAGGLLVRPPHDPARKAGEIVQVIPFRDSYF